MTVEQIIDGLNSSNPEERAGAEKALRDLGPEAVRPLMKLTRERAPLEVILILLSIGMFVPLVIKLAISPAIARRMWSAVGLIYAACFLGKLIWKWFDRRFGQSQMIRNWWDRRFGRRMASKTTLFQTRSKRARQILLSLEDVRYITPVCETLAIENPAYNIPKLQEAILTKLLSKIQATDGALLPLSARKKLYAFLLIDNALQHADFLIIILRALAQTGDKADIWPVSSLSHSLATTPKGIRVRTEAQHCLAALRERVDRMEVGKALLRASVEPGDQQDSLLRPAAGDGDTKERLLLRPAVDTLEELNLENKA
jgi:hypothetical protein